MRVLVLATDAYGGHGGIAYYNRCLTEALALMPEVDEVVIVPRVMRFTPGNLPAKIRNIDRAAGSKFRYLRTICLLVLGSWDLVICGHVNLLPIAAPLAAIKRARLVLQIHGVEAWQPVRSFARHWIRQATAVWSVSGVTRDRMNAWADLPISKYMIIPNAVYAERYGIAEKRQDLLDHHNVAGCRIMMTLARLSAAEQYKGVDEVLEAMPELLESEPSLRYLVAGDGDDRPRLEDKAKSLGLHDKVIFTGMVRECEKADLLRLADAFVMPGRGEGFGIVYLEALACGVPVVGSRLDGSREALRGGLLGELADPTDLASVRDAIRAALLKPKLVPMGLAYFSFGEFQNRLRAALLKVMDTCDRTRSA